MAAPTRIITVARVEKRAASLNVRVDLGIPLKTMSFQTDARNKGAHINMDTNVRSVPRNII